MRRWAVLAALAALVLAGAGWYLTAPPAPIRIGVIQSTSGTMAISERPLVDAARLAVEEINAGGGVLGRPLEMVVADGRSTPGTFATEAARLVDAERVTALFGGWTSASRKAMAPIVEQRDHLLFYPLQYEGLEQSPNIVYLGAAPNQQILPALRWSLANLGQRFFLVGSDYLFPRAANAIVRAQLERWPAEIVGEEYVPLGARGFAPLVARIAAAQPVVVLNTLNGDSNVAFFEAMRAAGLTAAEAPTMSFSIAEGELAQLPADTIAGHYAAWNYFQSLPSLANQRFVTRFRARFGAERVTSDPIESAYNAVHLYAAAVAAAGDTTPSVVRRFLKERSFAAPGGILFLDGRTQHAWKTIRIGRVRTDGQFDIVWTSGYPIAPQPFPPLRSQQEWTAMVDRLKAGWGGRWENPGREVR